MGVFGDHLFLPPLPETGTTIKETLEMDISQKINTGSNIMCRNIIVVNEVENCNLSGFKQVCDASIIAQTVTNEIDIRRYERTIKRSLDEQFDILIDDKVKEFEKNWEEMQKEIKDKKVVSNTSKLTIETSAEVVLRLRTDCSRNISANNMVLFDNVTCTDLAQIKGNTQEINASIISECAVNSALRNEGSLAVYDTLVQQLRYTTMKSDDMFSIIFLMLFLPFLLFLLPWIIRKSKTTKTPLISVLIIVFVATLIVWWPGYFAIEWGIWPWPYPGSTVKDKNGQMLCENGKLMKNLFVNKLVWFDGNCIASGADPCNVDDQLMFYPQCGLLGGGCDDPMLNTDKNAYIAAATACAGAPLSLGCRTEDLAKIFSDNTSNAYPGCTYCAQTGLFAKEGMGCDPANFKFDKYGSFTLVCPENDPDCIEDEAAYASVSPNECLDAAYHEKKRIYVEYRRACQAVENTTAKPGQPLRAQCPVDPYDYFDCDKDTGECNYVSTGNDPDVIKSCANSLDNCFDATYRVDKTKNDALAYACQKEYENWRKLNPSAWIATLVAYFLFIGLVIYLIMKNRDPSRANESFRLDNWMFFTTLSFLSCMIFVAGMFREAGNGADWVPSALTNTEGFDPEQAKTKANVILIILGLVFFLVIVAKIRYW